MPTFSLLHYASYILRLGNILQKTYHRITSFRINKNLLISYKNKNDNIKRSEAHNKTLFYYPVDNYT